MADLPKYVIRDVDRRGVTRYYLRRPGQSKVRIHGEPGTPAFEASYRAAIEGAEARADAQKPVIVEKVIPARNNTLGWLVDQYLRSGHFGQLDTSTKRVRELVFAHCMDEPISPGSPDRFRDLPLMHVTAKSMRVLRDRKRDKPGAANTRLKFMSAMYSWAMDEEVHDDIRFHPVRDVKRLPPVRADGIHSWTLNEIEQYEAHHQVGTQARLALAMLLYTGQRKSDIIRIGRAHVRQEWIRLTQFKNRNRNPTTLEIPIIPELQRIIDATKTGDMTYLVTAHGRPFTRAGFGNRMRDWCDEAGLPQCSSHGLRKAAAERLALLGCSDREIMSITGHKTSREVDRYTKGARQRQMAESALAKSNVVQLKTSNS